ncbi:unnamed protein product [Rotaria sordida]|uniref:Uncharacterized protein n=1 Tax=Rotaria sordida TaxID=392033 RepID=A0A818RRG7_9BILA|nr:unnamed protein product [Rotaria sordida]CAF3654735.1 unnamed protein product [Rotaria sordida]
MFDQEIESLSNKLVQFIQDLAINIQTIYNKKNFTENFFQLFQLRSDYSKQLAYLFDILINRFIEEFLLNRITNQIILNLDPVQIWRSIQCCIDQLNDIQCQNLCLIIKHIRILNNYFYNLLLQLKNGEFLKIDQIRILNQNLIEELNHLSECLINFTTNFYNNCQNINNKSSKPIDTYLFQSQSTAQYPNNNNHINQTIPNASPNEKSNISPAINSNCYPYNIIRNPCPQQQPCWTGIGQTHCIQTNPIRCPIGTIPTVATFPYTKPMYCGINPNKTEIPPLCFPTPIVYTPEMETLFSSGGIIYARKSGNTWIAENLGTLIETLKDIGQTIDMNEHYEILVRKTGELVVHRKRGRRKRMLQETLNNKRTSSYDDMNINEQYFESNLINDDD